MKKIKKRIRIIFLLFIITFGLYISFIFINNQINSIFAYDTTTNQQTNETLNNTSYINSKLTNISNEYLILVNKGNYLPKDYIPNDLVQMSNKYTYGTLYLKSDANSAFEKLCNSAKANGVLIVGISGYRSFEKQANLYNDYVAKDGIFEAERYVARAGHSEHQTGLAIDVSNGLSGTQFANTESYIWLKDNAHRFGFILRYPEGKEDITGYMFESWHYRYIGVEYATIIYENNLTFEEYLNFR